MFLVLDGVACTGKTTTLRQLNNRPDCRIHLSDLYEISVAVGLTRNFSDSLIYTAIRGARYHPAVEPDLVHYFDRSNVSSVLYAHVFQPTFSPELLEKDCVILKKCGIMEPWTNTLILLCKEGQEELVVEKMTARGNGLDVLSVDYVNVQNRAFKVWAKVFGYPTYTIDFTQPFDKQQEEIVEILDGFLMNSTRIL